MITLFGINNCDTVKKSQKWLKAHNIDYRFYDFKKQPLTADLLSEFVKLSDWSLLLNKRSTTFRQLSDEIKNNLTDEVMFAAVLTQPTLLKRPLLLLSPSSDIEVQNEGKIESKTESNINTETLHLGFKAEQYHSLLIA